MRPAICVYGNCQVQAIAAVLSQHRDLKEHEIHASLAFLGQSPPDELVERCTLFIRHSMYPMPSFAARLPAQARRISVPALSCSVFWPYAFDRPNEPAGWRFPYGDRYLIRQVKDEMSAEQAADNYLAFDVPKAVNIDRLLMLEKIRWRNEDAKCDVAMGDFTASGILRERLFFTPDHPSDRLLVELTNRILCQIGLAGFNEPDWNSHVHVLSPTELPVHPKIVRHFALPFLGDHKLYRLHGGYLELDARETYVRYARALQNPSIVEGIREALASVRSGDAANALNVCNLIRSREPSNRDAAATLAIVCALSGQREQAVDLLSASLWEGVN